MNPFGHYSVFWVNRRNLHIYKIHKNKIHTYIKGKKMCLNGEIILKLLSSHIKGNFK